MSGPAKAALPTKGREPSALMLLTTGIQSSPTGDRMHNT